MARKAKLSGIFILLALGILHSCSKDEDDIRSGDIEYLIFGHYYGECFGETCVETFKLTGSRLFEDTRDTYAGGDFDFQPLEKEIFEQVKDLVDYIPERLLNADETSFGCPDCADGGGLYIEISENGRVKSWRIDQMKSNVPEYLHTFMDKVNEKIEEIHVNLTPIP